MSLPVSVIIPSFARPESLANCLHGLRTSQLPEAQYEIIVVDDGSPRSPETIASRFGARCIRQQNAGPGPARNTGAARAQGGLLAFIDDDCVPDPNWLPALLTAHQRFPNDALYGHVANGLRGNLFSEASQQILHCIYDYLLRNPRGVDDSVFSPFATTNNLAVPRALFQQLSGFNNAFRLAAAEDREFCARWLRQGWHLRSVPAAVVLHYHHLSMASFWRQHYRYGRGSQQVRQVRATLGQGGQCVEPLGFYLSLVSYPCRDGISRRSIKVSALIALSQAAMAAGVAHQMIASQTTDAGVSSSRKAPIGRHTLRNPEPEMDRNQAGAE